MTTQFSDDVLALNPGVAKQVKKSRAKTPSGKGHGHTDNTQAYTVVPYTPGQRRAILCSMASHFVAMLGIWGTDTDAQRAAKAAAERVIEEASE